jgi:hypothetical protein
MQAIHVMELKESAGTMSEEPYAPAIINVADLKKCHDDWVSEQLLRGACLVANNTAAAISKARKLITLARGEADEDEKIPFLQVRCL